MIKVTDYIVKRLVEHGIENVFMISGGGAMHLNDSIGKCKEIKYICNHHEQASAIAAEGYARIAGKLGVVIVTTGPGGTNTLTGVIGQWLDSVPVLYLSGQVKYETSIASCPEIGLRQLGDQEINIVDIVRPVTKFAVMLTDPLDVRKVLEEAIATATEGRPGPVWIDIPLNVQSSFVKEGDLQAYIKSTKSISTPAPELDQAISETIRLLQGVKRPVVLAGNGIRIAGAQNELLSFVHRLHIPVVTSFLGRDLVPTDDPCYAGNIGTIGNRFGNFAVQNCDLLISIGSRNNIRQVGYNWKSFARAAKKIIVDIDPAELKKPTVKPDVAIATDAKFFLNRLDAEIKKGKFPDWTSWLSWNSVRRGRYPVLRPEYAQSDSLVHPYYFISELSARLQSGDIVVTGNATPSIVYYQLGIIKDDQRTLWNSGCAAMGYDLPAAIGAALAGKKRRVICLAGDGSLQMNIQELQTMRYYNLPIKLFILDNAGYISIRQTQEALFSSRLVGSGPDSGVGNPDFKKILEAYGIPCQFMDTHEAVSQNLDLVLNAEGPSACQVKLLSDYKFIPKASSEKTADGRMVSKPLEDMFPFLDREEFRDNLLIPEWRNQEQ